MIPIMRRATSNLSLEGFDAINPPQQLREIVLRPPAGEQHILRCPIVGPDISFWGEMVPEELKWTNTLINAAMAHQWDFDSRAYKNYCYVTVRHGHIRSSLDDVWHVDGFSMRTPHIPEQNYIWSSANPTEFGACPIVFPADFDPLRHNIQYYIQEQMDRGGAIWQGKPRMVYITDPYVIHRRPHCPEQIWRTFVRVSFTPIPIEDRNNYFNPALPDLHFDRDGLADFRDQLERYAPHA